MFFVLIDWLPILQVNQWLTWLQETEEDDEEEEDAQ